MQHVNVEQLHTVPFLQLVASMRHWQRRISRRETRAPSSRPGSWSAVHRRIAHWNEPRAEPSLFDRLEGQGI